jgi:hypothetical protein
MEAARENEETERRRRKRGWKRLLIPTIEC